MNNKGGTFLDTVVAMVILSFLFILLSNYTGYIVKAEKNLNANLQMQIDVNNLIEYIYYYENWQDLNEENWGDNNFTSSSNLEVSYNYDNELSDYDTEKIFLEIKGPMKSKKYVLERNINTKNY